MNKKKKNWWKKTRKKIGKQFFVCVNFRIFPWYLKSTDLIDNDTNQHKNKILTNIHTHTHPWKNIYKNVEEEKMEFIFSEIWSELNWSEYPDTLKKMKNIIETHKLIYVFLV